MKTQRLNLKTSDGVCDAFIAHPQSGGPFPAVLLYMDAWGPRPYLDSMAEKIAAHGFFVLLPNLLYRVRPAPLLDVHYPLNEEQEQTARPQLMDLLKTFDPEASLRDGQDFLDFLSAHKDVRSGPVAVTGYCMGGSMAIRMAARYPENIATAASFHAGRLATDAPNSPHLLAAQIRARLYFGHAEKDASLPPEQIQHLEDALDAAGVTYSSEVYKGCAHGFCMLDLPAGNRHAVEQHWSKLFALLGQSL